MEDDIALQEIPFLQISGGHDCEVEKCEANTSSDHPIFRRLQSDVFQVYKSRNQDESEENKDENPSHSMERTNAYGQMEFVGPDRRTRAEYIRLSDQSLMDDVGLLMRNTMSLKEWPKILISVVGGLTKFEISESLKRSLQKDLLKVCMKVAGMQKETWFITNALDVGVTSMIAEAVEGYKYHDTSVIGITSWGVVAHKELLVQESKKIKLPRYPIVKELHKASKKKHKETFFLNKDHTHFFLVDTGKPGELSSKEIEFRSRFEKYVVDRQIAALQNKHKRAGLQGKSNFIPAVQLVVNGGYQTLQQIKSTLFPGGDDEGEPIMPIIVVGGSGRVADWITAACKMQDSKSRDEDKQLKASTMFTNNLKYLLPLQQAIKGCFPEKCEELYQLILKISKERRQYITIYEHGDCLDDKILWSFIQRRNRTSEEPSEQHSLTLEQYKMVMLWGRPDIAEKELRNMMKSPHSTEQMDQILKEMLMRALRKQNIKFVDLVFKMGFDMSQVDQNMLEILYSKVLERKSGTKKDGLKVLLPKKLIGMQPREIYTREHSSPTMLQKPNFKKAKKQNKMTTEMMSEVSKAINNISACRIVDYKMNPDIDDPFKDLFLWAVMCNRQETAIALWKRGQNPLAKALVARKMYLKIAKKYHRSTNYDDDVYKSFFSNAKHFGTLANELLQLCADVRPPSTANLIKYKIPNWGNRTIVELAVSSEFQEFVSHPRCKDMMDARWRGDIASGDGEYLNVKVVVGIFFLPFIFKFLKFKDEFRHSQKKCCKSSNRDDLQCHQTCAWNYITCTIRGWYNRIAAFLSAPITKFWTNSMTYLIFLSIFTFVMLNKMKTNPDIQEYLLLTFIISFLFEEIRQIFREYGISLKQKLRNWWRYHWNKLDTAALVIFGIAFIFQMIPHSKTALQYSHYLYAVDYFLWVLKILQLFSLNRKIGVYVVMLERMVRKQFLGRARKHEEVKQTPLLLVDVIYFVVIILVLLLAYSIARFTILYPNNVISFKNKSMSYFLRRVFMAPTFQLFGELFISSPESAEEGKTVFGTSMDQGIANNDTTMYNTDRQDEVFVMWLTFVYMVVAALLVVNLLIAVFNNTYTIVQQNANKVWHWQNYHLVVEYQKRSFMPPPFSIFSHIKVFVQYLLRARQKRIIEEADLEDLPDIPMEKYFEKYTDLYKLLQFENECLANYLQTGQSREDKLRTDDECYTATHRKKSVFDRLKRKP